MMLWYRRKKGAPPKLDGKLLPDKWKPLKAVTPRMKREIKERRYCEFTEEPPTQKRRGKGKGGK